MYGLGKGGYEKYTLAKTEGEKGQCGVSQQVKRGLETKKQRNKVENNKIKIRRTYKNQNEPQHIFFFFSLFVQFFLFEILLLYSHFCPFSFIIIFVLFFFSFQQVTIKWNDENKGTFIKWSTNPPHLFETHFQNNSKALFLPKI